MKKLRTRLKKIGFIIIIVLILSPVSAFFLIKLPAVQSFLVHQVTKALSEKLYPALVSVKAVNYSLFTRLVADDILVRDMRGDTLLWIEETAFTIASVKYRSKNVEFSNIHLNKGVFNLYTYPIDENTKSTNVKDIIMHLRGNVSDTVSIQNKPKQPWIFTVNGLEISKFSFTFRNMNKPTINPDSSVIDFKNLNLSDIYLNARNLRLKQDTLFFSLRNISCVEQSGYRLKQLTAESGYVCGNQTFLRTVTILDNFSSLVMKYYKMDYENVSAFNDYEEKVRMEADFDNGMFSFRSIGYMAKKFHINPDFYLTGIVGGTVSNLRSDKIEIRSASLHTKIMTKFSLVGLPDINETTINVKISELTTDTNDLTYILQGFAQPDTLNLLPAINSFGKIRITGSFTGLYNDFVAKGILHSSPGYVVFDAALAIDARLHRVYLKGDVHMNKFNAGKLIAAPYIGEITGELTTEGIISSSDKGGVQLQTSGNVHRFDFYGYPYTNIDLNGVVSNNGFNGKMNINDPNLNLTFSGIVKYHADDTVQAQMLDFGARINYADLTALNINKRDSVSILKAHVKVNYSAKEDIYDGIGNITVSDIKYTGNSGELSMNDITLESLCEKKRRQLSFYSDFATVQYKGNIPLFSFVQRAIDIIPFRNLPDFANRTTINNDTLKKSEGVLKMVVKNAENLTNILLPSLYISPQTELTAMLTKDNSFLLSLVSNELEWDNQYLKKLSLQAYNNYSNQSYAVLKTAETQLFGFIMRNTILQAEADDKISVHTTYDNKTSPKNYGKLSAVIELSRKHENKNILADIQLHTSEIIINDSTWIISPAGIILDEKIKIHNFYVHNNTQSIRIDGCLSKDISDTLSLNLSNFDVANVNYLTRHERYKFNGSISGIARVTDIYHTPRFFADIRADKILVNDNELGSLIIRSFWNDNEKRFYLNVSVQQNAINPININGFYSPTRKYIDITGIFEKFPIVHIEPLFDGTLTKTQGTLSGSAHLHGNLQHLSIKGNNLRAEKVTTTVDYLKTRYTFSAPVFMDETAVGFKDVEVSDGFGGKATLSAMLIHKDFRNLQYEITAYMHNLCVMKTTPKDNEFFYGNAFASGAAIIKGRPRETTFDINLKTEKNTIIHIPASTPVNTNNMQLLTFVHPQKDTSSNDFFHSVKTMVQQPSNMDIALNISVSPETEIMLEMDRRTGDVIRSFGSGEIKMNINPSIGKFNIYGDYYVDRGDYMFSIQNFNLITKKFYIEQGGRILFNGDINKTNLDLSATYKTKVSLNGLLADSSSVMTRRPVDCRIYVTGSMFQPSLRFAIDVHNLDAETNARVQSALSTDEKITRQFLTLLAVGSFFPDQESAINSGMLSGMAGSATELLSNQINNVLNQLNIPFDIGFTYLPSWQGQNDAYDMNFSTQLWNNRLVVNGSFGSKNTSEQIFSNDLNMDVRLDAKGKLYFKIFTRSVDQYTDLIGNSQRYGIGVVYQEEFTTFKELVDKILRKRKKNVTSQQPEQTDTEKDTIKLQSVEPDKNRQR